jgi:hypothetical protein
MSNATIAVDRIEGDRAILDVGGETVEIPASLLPEGAGEGSVLTLSLAPAVERTAAEARLERLRRRGPSSGPIDL